MTEQDIIGFRSEPYEPKTQLDKVVWLLNQLCLNKITSEQAVTELQSILSTTSDTKTAEDILDKICKSVPYIWGSNTEQSEKLLPKDLALKAMRQYAHQESMAARQSIRTKMAAELDRVNAELSAANAKIAELEKEISDLIDLDLCPKTT